MARDLDFTEVLEDIGQMVEDAAKVNITKNHSIDTGRLRGSIKHELTGPNEVTIGSNVEYGIYVEMGTGLFAENGDGRKDVPWHYQDEEGNWHTTSGQHPKPFLRPALTDNEELIEEMIQQEANKQIAEIFKEASR